MLATVRDRALGPVDLSASLAARVAGRALLARPEIARIGLHVGVLVTDPLDRPGRGNRLVAGLRLGLEHARDLDTSVTAAGATPYGPALVDTATGLLDAGADALVVTSAGVAGLVGPLCASRGIGLVVADEGDLVAHPAQHRRGVLRRTERHWQEAFVLGQWASRCLEGSLFQLATRDEERGDSVLALRAGFVDSGGAVTGSVEVWPKSATAAAQVARVSGARVIAVHATGHQLQEIVRALRSARVPAEIVVAGRGVDERDVAELGRGGPVYAASSWHRADRPGLATTLELGTGERPDVTIALGYDIASSLGEAARKGVLAEITSHDEAEQRAVVVRRAASGRVSVVARRVAPTVAPDLDAVATGPVIAALPHHG